MTMKIKKIQASFVLSLALLFISQLSLGQVYVPNISSIPNFGFEHHMYHWNTFYYGNKSARRMSKLAKQEALDSARANIALLKQNTLVVRLKTGSKKIGVLEELLENPNIKDKYRRRYQRMLDKTTTSIKIENEHLKRAFLEHYHFSKVMFMPDTSAVALKSGVRKGIFLNEKLELDTTITLEGSYFVAYHESSDSGSKRHTATEGLRIVDKNYKALKYPFPSSISRPSWGWIIGLSLDGYSSRDHKRHFDYLVKRFNEHMEIE